MENYVEVRKAKFQNGDLVTVAGVAGVWTILETRFEEDGVIRYLIFKAPDMKTQHFRLETELLLGKSGNS